MRFLVLDSTDGKPEQLLMHRPTNHFMRQSILDEIRSSKSGSETKVSNLEVSTSEPNLVTSDSEKAAIKEAPQLRSEPASSSEDDVFVRGVASAGLDSRTVRVLEARIFDLIKEILDVDSMNVLRRNFVALLHQSIKLFFSTTLKTWASAQAKVHIICIENLNNGIKFLNICGAGICIRRKSDMAS